MKFPEIERVLEQRIQYIQSETQRRLEHNQLVRDLFELTGDKTIGWLIPPFIEMPYIQWHLETRRNFRDFSQN